MGIINEIAQSLINSGFTVSKNENNGDTESAVAFTLGTTLLSVITIPLLYWAVCLLLYMDLYYSKELQKTYGVIGIEIELKQ